MGQGNTFTPVCDSVNRRGVWSEGVSVLGGVCSGGVSGLGVWSQGDLVWGVWSRGVWYQGVWPGGCLDRGVLHIFFWGLQFFGGLIEIFFKFKFF